MTNAINVDFIVQKLLSFLANSTDDHFRSDLVNQITQCAERFAPSNTWYIQTIIKVFEFAGEKVNKSVAQTLIQLIADGIEELDDEDEEDCEVDPSQSSEERLTAKNNELRCEAVEHFLDLLEKPKLPAILAQTTAWVLGEYGYLSISCSKEVIMERLSQLITQSSGLYGVINCRVDNETKAQVITAISKLIAQSGTCPGRVLQVITLYAQSRSLDVQQRCLEVLALLKSGSEIMADVLPVDASCEDIQVDERLSFLDGLVQEAIQNGAQLYSPPKEFLQEFFEDGQESSKKSSSGLNLTPYAEPKIPLPVSTASTGILSSPISNLPTSPLQQPQVLSMAMSQGNHLIGTGKGVPQVWGKTSAVTTTPDAAAPTVLSPYPPAPPANNSSNPSLSGLNEPHGPAPVPVNSLPIPVVKVDTEKEKLAKQLFGGLTGSTAPGSARAMTKRRGSGVDAVVDANNVPHKTSSTALVDDVSVASSVSLTAATTSPGDQSNNIPSLHHDLLQLDDVAPNVAPVEVNVNAMNAASVSAVPASNADRISELFGEIALNNEATAAAHCLLPASSSSNGDSRRHNNLVPLSINTEQFGRRWGMTLKEIKQTVAMTNFPQMNLVNLQRAMPSVYHHVESIQQTLEAIFAATDTSLGTVVLVHIKLSSTRKTCEMTVRTSSQDLCDSEGHRIALGLSSFRS